MSAPEVFFPDAQNYERPCVLEAKLGGQVLRCVGTTPHFYDPNDPQFQMICDQWDAFMNSLADKDTALAVCEGGVRMPQETAEASTVLEGEPGLLAFLAGRDGISLVAFEPERYSEVGLLLDRGHEPDVVSYFYYMRNLPQWYPMQPQPSLEEFFAADSRWGRTRLPRHVNELDFSFDALARTHRQLFGSEFDPENPTNSDFFLKQMSPIDPQTPTQRVARDCHILRDQHLADRIAESLKAGNSLYVQSHVLHIRGIEPSLNQLPGLRLAEVEI